MTVRQRISPPFTDLSAYDTRVFGIMPRSAPVSIGDIKISGGATAAAISAAAAAASQAAAASSATAAADSATATMAAEDAAGLSEIAAGTSAGNAAASAAAAAASATAAAGSLTSFTNVYYGPLGSDPTTRPSGAARVTGDLYYRTTAPIGLKVWDGSTWGATVFGDAPSDGQEYVRKNALWQVVTGGGGGGGGIGDAPGDGQDYVRNNTSWLALNWTSLDGKPSTFAPSAHSHPQSEVTNLTTDLAAKAPLASPTFTGNPVAPTPSPGDNDTSIATTAFVTAAVAAAPFAPLASPVFTGNPTAPTPATADNDTSIATTAYVKANLASIIAGATVSDSPPSSPSNGNLWWESDTGRFWVYYTDANTSQWIEIAGGGGGAGDITISTSAPSGGNDGDVWFKVS